MPSYDVYELIKPDKEIRKGKIKRISKKVFVTGFIILSLVILAIIYWFCFIKPSILNARESKAISNIIDEVDISDIPESEAKGKTDMQLKVAELKEQYPNLVGWIRIEGTNIDYPVMQWTDNQHYLTYSYNGKKSKLGSIYLHKDADVNKPSSNFIIYGHNITTGVMFNELLDYKKQSFYNDHKIIEFTTINKDAKYEIVSVFISKVYNKNDNVFKYYNFINASNEAEYNDYISNVKRLSLYNTGVNAEYGDQLITLTTCEYSQKNGRIVIVARERK